MEDVLTSNVFGMMWYLPPGIGLLRFIGHASGYRDCEPLAALLHSEASVSYQFWPSWASESGRACEPDVVLEVDTLGRRLLILVEAKFRSGKSSEADESYDPSDQLAREWDCLTTYAAASQREPYLVYLTADIGMPRRELEVAIDEYTKKRPGRAEPRFYWLTWRRLSGLFRDDPVPMLRDLAALAERLDLVFFHGIGRYVHTEAGSWNFDAPSPIAAGNTRFQWDKISGPTKISWTYAQ